jgi:hypothetical protein
VDRPEGFTRSQIKSGLSSGCYQVAGKESAEARQCVVLFGPRLMNLTLPRTAALPPGYRLLHSRSTSSRQAVRDCFFAASTVFYECRESAHSIMLAVSG